MDYRQLGRTNLNVSAICLGTMTWGEQNSETEAFAQIERAKSAGINFIDTAEMYPVPPKAETYATTERYIGNYFKSRGDRADWILASKIAGPGNTIDYTYRRDGDRLYVGTIAWSIWSLRLSHEARPDVLRSARAGFLRTTLR